MRNVVLKIIAYFVAGGAVILFGWQTIQLEELLASPVEINDAFEFEAKKELFQNSRGKKIVLLGDSLSFGRTMVETKPWDWRNYTLDKSLASCLQNQNIEENIQVWNFALDGAVPADFALLRRALGPVDKVFINVNSRSFTGEFMREGSAITRSWINELPSLSIDNKQLEGQTSTIINGHKIQIYLAKLRLFKRSNFDRDPKEFMSRYVSPFFLQVLKQKKEKELLDFQTLLKLKTRYKNISFDREKSAQVRAFIDLLNDPAVYMFQTKENPRLVRQVINKKVQKAIRNGFEDLRKSVQTKSKSGRLINAPEELEYHDFLDFMHVTPVGYSKYAKKICTDLSM